MEKGSPLLARVLALTFIACLFLAAAAFGLDAFEDDELSNAELRVKAAAEAIVANQPGLVYDDYLLPAQREALDRDAFVECLSVPEVDSSDVEIRASDDETISVASLGDIDAVAVEYRISYQDDQLHRGASSTLHAVERGGTWYVYYQHGVPNVDGFGGCSLD